jgi:hypothetical protein
MVPPRLTLNELYAMRRDKQTMHTQCFDRVLEQCHRRIRMVAGLGGMNTFFEVPGIVAGLPLYNLNQCTVYVIEQLRKNGMLVQVLPPPHVSVVYISWDPKDVSPPRPALTGSNKNKQKHQQKCSTWNENAKQLRFF